MFMNDSPSSADNKVSTGLNFSAMRMPSRAQLLDEAAKVVPNIQILINIVSKRVRELNYGDGPLIPVPSNMPAGNIALMEIVQGKITVEHLPDEK